ncbi:hypothetical protein CISG_10360 [Coccidioides immitis RMSCC 3703]|uniref:Uncharacterized protein n=1 Tax=Coccidioides immitis RMSCC 3703 TaxID=454286 RepID=A0A0J8TLT2_COCIT|nr:hypothetical protein CISG_10360 [Coccidioides immitis RMSCC 3703]
MSFQLPNHIPAFNSTQQQIKDGSWPAASASRSQHLNPSTCGGDPGLSQKLGNFINPSQDLPIQPDPCPSPASHHSFTSGPEISTPPPHTSLRGLILASLELPFPPHVCRDGRQRAPDRSPTKINYNYIIPEDVPRSITAKR